MLNQADRWRLGLRVDEVESAFLATIRQVNDAEFSDLAREIDEAKTGSEGHRRLSLAWMSRLEQLGLWELAVPSEYGGPGLPLRTICLVVEELATTFPSAATSMLGNFCATALLAASSNVKLRESYLREMATGKRRGAWALTEPAAGSDTSNIQTKAVVDGDTVRIDGEKCFITSSGLFDFYCVFARIADDDAPRPRSIAVLVERDREGLEITRLEEKMGLRGTSTGALRFDGLKVPVSNIISTKGIPEALRVLTWTRIVTASMALGVARGAFDRAADYAADREVFGDLLLNQPVIRYKLADLWIEIEGARSLAFRAAQIAADGGPLEAFAAAAKVLGTDIAMRTTQEAVQVLGGYGYLKDYDVERLMRDTKVLQIFDGANEILRTLVVARELFGR